MFSFSASGARYLPCHRSVRGSGVAGWPLLRNAKGTAENMRAGCGHDKVVVEGWVGGWGYSLVACLSHLTIDHASLSRRSTVRRLLVETPPTFGRSARVIHMLHENVLLNLSPSCFAVCSHHQSPRIAIVFSLPSINSVPNFSMSHPSIFLIFGGLD